MIETTETPTRTTPDPNLDKLVQTIANAADDRKAGDITILKVADISYLADYFIIVTGYSTTQVRAIADSIEAAVELECDRVPRRVEGKAEGSWILQDFGDAIVHIFLPKEREFYNLEAFWGHAERLPSPTDRRGE
ncbi:ribosome silencing factor [Pannus brasiliensis CCIBt3594]|uniref:Ribosomal silencing factor RsfS n=1 Tax=Pannus brasiliensis CCIBt3594 TaxID=1427578 RepID=A0AAW9QZL3_9CHRO